MVCIPVKRVNLNAEYNCATRIVRFGIPNGEALGTAEVAAVGGQVLQVRVRRRLSDDQVELLSLHRASGERGVIVGMSPAVRRELERAILSHAKVLLDNWAAFLTLTHGRDAPEWRSSKVSLHKWQRRIARLEKQGIIICGWWVAELQKRGAVHYHLALALLNSSHLSAVEAESVFEGLGKSWIDLTGDEGSDHAAREERGYRGDMLRSEPGSLVGLVGYLGKIAGLNAELAKTSQKEAAAYGGVRGKVGRKHLAPWRRVYQVPVDAEQVCRRAVAVRSALIYADLARVPEPSDKNYFAVRGMVALSDTGKGLEAEYLMTGDVGILRRHVWGQLDYERRRWRTKAGYAAWRMQWGEAHHREPPLLWCRELVDMVQYVHEQCRDRGPGWDAVPTRDSVVEFQGEYLMSLHEVPPYLERDWRGYL